MMASAVWPKAFDGGQARRYTVYSDSPQCRIEVVDSPRRNYVRPFPIEELVDRGGSRFTVVIAAAKRAKQIKDGAPPLVNLPTRNPLTIALHEIAAGLILIGDAPEIPEEDAAPSEPAELAAPDAVEALLDKAAGRGRAAAKGDEDDELDEEIADELDEEVLEDEAEEEDEEEDDEDEEDEDEEIEESEDEGE